MEESGQTKAKILYLRTIFKGKLHAIREFPQGRRENKIKEM